MLSGIEQFLIFEILSIAMIISKWGFVQLCICTFKFNHNIKDAFRNVMLQLTVDSHYCYLFFNFVKPLLSLYIQAS